MEKDAIVSHNTFEIVNASDFHELAVIVIKMDVFSKKRSGNMHHMQ